MKLEHFTYGFNGKDYRYVATKGVEKLLGLKARVHLKTLSGPGVAKTWIPEDKVVARSYLGYKLDDYQRRCVWNHTILIGILDYIQIQNFDVVDKHFIREDVEAPTSFEPLRIDTK